MKKFYLLLVLMLAFALALTGCGETVTPENVEPDAGSNNAGPQEGKSTEPLSSPDEIAALKNEAVKADFVEANCGDTIIGTKLYLEGRVDVIYGTDIFDVFLLTTVEGDGFGMYDIQNLYKNELNIEEGDSTKVWGLYNGRDGGKTGAPVIAALAVEKVE